MPKEYEKIPPFNPHNNCTGHGIYMLDIDYTDKDDRDLLVKCLNHFIDEKELA